MSIQCSKCTCGTNPTLQKKISMAGTTLYFQKEVQKHAEMFMYHSGERTECVGLSSVVNFINVVYKLCRSGRDFLPFDLRPLQNVYDVYGIPSEIMHCNGPIDTSFSRAQWIKGQMETFIHGCVPCVITADPSAFSQYSDGTKDYSFMVDTASILGRVESHGIEFSMICIRKLNIGNVYIDMLTGTTRFVTSSNLAKGVSSPRSVILRTDPGMFHRRVVAKAILFNRQNRPISPVLVISHSRDIEQWRNACVETNPIVLDVEMFSDKSNKKRMREYTDGEKTTHGVFIMTTRLLLNEGCMDFVRDFQWRMVIVDDSELFVRGIGDVENRKLVLFMKIVADMKVVCCPLSVNPETLDGLCDGIGVKREQGYVDNAGEVYSYSPMRLVTVEVVAKPGSPMPLLCNSKVFSVHIKHPEFQENNHMRVARFALYKMVRDMMAEKYGESAWTVFSTEKERNVIMEQLFTLDNALCLYPAYRDSEHVWKSTHGHGPWGLYTFVREMLALEDKSTHAEVEEELLETSDKKDTVDIIYVHSDKMVRDVQYHSTIGVLIDNVVTGRTDCILCKCKITNMYVLSNPCFHVFHERCFRDWTDIQDVPVCPMCKIVIQSPSVCIHNDTMNEPDIVIHKSLHWNYSKGALYNKYIELSHRWDNLPASVLKRPSSRIKTVASFLSDLVTETSSDMLSFPYSSSLQNESSCIATYGTEFYKEIVLRVKNGAKRLQKIVVFSSDEYLLRMAHSCLLLQSSPFQINSIIVSESVPAEEIENLRLLFYISSASDFPVVLFTTYSFSDIVIDSVQCVVTIDPPNAHAFIRSVDRALGASLSKAISFVTFSTIDSVDGVDYRRWFTDNRNKRHHNSASSLATVLSSHEQSV